MARYPLRYLPSGFVLIEPEDDCDRVVDALLETGYSEEFCLARDLDADFACRLMEAGFLVMSMELKPEGFCILLPKLHLVRSALFFPNLHIKKSIRPFLSRYELRVNTDFGFILNKCVETHGEDWLTPPLAAILKSMSNMNDRRVKPVSFAVYRDDELKAGEAGVAIGRVYTSYSGYYDEKNAGTVQMILMTQWLEKTGFAFLDLGMPMEYKTLIGAQDISPRRFVELFRSARY